MRKGRNKNYCQIAGVLLASLVTQSVKNLLAVQETTYNAGCMGSIPGSGKSLGRKWQPILVFLPGEFHGQRGLVGYSPWGKKSQT